jgi:glycosyltransferase involved in cell wall biosynthesis
VAISRATREHYLRVFPHFPAERVRVISPCSRFRDASVPGRRPRSAAALQEGRFWLSVGTLEPRKNQERLVEAYVRYLALGGPAMPLVLAGGKGWMMDGFAQRIAAMGLGDCVILTGYVSDEELAWLYRHCFANLYPSLFEGFGLPVLEGMQFGAATIASSASSIPEVAGDAGLLVDPLDTEGWAQAMRAVASEGERHARLRAAAPVQAARFDRAASARALLDLYEEASRAAKRSPPVEVRP